MKTLKDIKLIIDFDSTFIKKEGLEELAKLVLKNNNQKNKILKKINKITNLGMEGKIDFKTSLQKRLYFLKPHISHIKDLSNKLLTEVSDSFVRNKNFLCENAENIYIFSGGFIDFMFKVLAEYGIKKSNIYANNFIYDDNGNVLGFDEDNFLSQKQGKVKQLQSIDLKGKIYVIGDGYTDYELKKNGKADKFFAFIENIKRPEVVNKADIVLNSLDDFLNFI